MYIEICKRICSPPPPPKKGFLQNAQPTSLSPLPLSLCLSVEGRQRNGRLEMMQAVVVSQLKKRLNLLLIRGGPRSAMLQLCVAVIFIRRKGEMNR